MDVPGHAKVPGLREVWKHEEGSYPDLSSVYCPSPKLSSRHRIEEKPAARQRRVLDPKPHGQGQSQLPQMIGHDNSHVE
jgi:hypothetical protein